VVIFAVAANSQVIGMPEVEDIHVARVHHCPLVLLYLDLEAELWLTKGLLVAAACTLSRIPAVARATELPTVSNPSSLLPRKLLA